jgi:hypothetical protein
MKFAVQQMSLLAVFLVRLLFGAEATKVYLLAVYSDHRDPFITHLVRALQRVGIFSIFVSSTILGILAGGGVPKIGPAIVGRIAISVIYKNRFLPGHPTPNKARTDNALAIHRNATG